MYTNLNLAAPVGVLLFFGTGFLLFVVGLELIYSIIRKKVGVANFALLCFRREQSSPQENSIPNLALTHRGLPRVEPLGRKVML